MALSGLVPAADAELPALTWRDSDGRVFLSPKKALSPALGKALSAVGVELSKTTGPADKRAISCWAEAITARRAAEPEAALSARLGGFFKNTLLSSGLRASGRRENPDFSVRKNAVNIEKNKFNFASASGSR